MKLILKVKGRKDPGSFINVKQIDINFDEGILNCKDKQGEREEIELKDIEAIRIED